MEDDHNFFEKGRFFWKMEDDHNKNNTTKKTIKIKAKNKTLVVAPLRVT
jgi:hypothetical protein